MPIIYCPQCGKELPEQGNFCKYCGCPVNFEQTGIPVHTIMPDNYPNNPLQKTTPQNRLLGAYPKLSIAAAVVAFVMLVGVITLAGSSNTVGNSDFTANLISGENSDSDMTGHYQEIYIKGENSELTETDIKALRDTGNDKDLFDLNVYSDDTARMTTKNGGDISFTIKDDGFYMSGVYKCPYSYSNGIITLEVPVKGITMKFRKVR